MLWSTDWLSYRYLILALAFYVYPDDVSDGVGGIFSKLAN